MCGLASPGSGLSERKALDFLPFFFFFFPLKADSKAAGLGSKGQEGVERSRALSLGGQKAVPQAGWTGGGSAERCAGSPGHTGHGRSCRPLRL